MLQDPHRRSSSATPFCTEEEIEAIVVPARQVAEAVDIQVLPLPPRRNASGQGHRRLDPVQGSSKVPVLCGMNFACCTDSGLNSPLDPSVIEGSVLACKMHPPFG